MLTNFRKFPFHSLHFKLLQNTCFPDILKALLLGRIRPARLKVTLLEEKRALHLSISSSCQVLLVALAVPSRSHPDKERTLQPAAAIWNNASCILGRTATPPTKSEQNVQPNNHHPAAKLTPAIQWSQMQINSLAFVWWCNCQTAHSNEYLFNCVIHR